MSELKPCPFCGGEAKGVRAAKAYHVYCTCCGADVMASTMKAMTTCQVNAQQFKAERKWNERTVECALTETLRLKEEECKQLSQDKENLISVLTHAVSGWDCEEIAHHCGVDQNTASVVLEMIEG